MSKYSEEHLVAMAKSALWYKTNNPLLYIPFLRMLSIRTRLTVIDVEKRIEKMAEGHFEE